ncbi:hypothetical protein [Streptomyces sp. NPDC006335]
MTARPWRSGARGIAHSRRLKGQQWPGRAGSRLAIRVVVRSSGRSAPYAW